MRNSNLDSDIAGKAVNATDRLLIRLGYAKISMDDVANEASISKGQLYLYFRNKSDLVLAREDRITALVRENLARLARHLMPWKEMLEQMLSLRVMLRFDSAQQYCDCMDEILHDVGSDLRERHRQYLAEEAKIIARVLQKSKIAGTLRHSLHLGETLVLATNALLPINIPKEALRERREMERRTGRVIEILLQGLRNAAPSPKIKKGRGCRNTDKADFALADAR